MSQTNRTSIEAAIARNRERIAVKCQLRAVLVRVFEYEDRGDLEKYNRIVARLRARLTELRSMSGWMAD